MKKVVLLQIFATLAVALGFFLWGGDHAAVSALLMGFACAIPNAIFALNLGVITKLKPRISPLVFLIGGFIKIVVIGMLIVLIAVLYKELVWSAAIASIVAVLNCSFLGLFTRE